MENKNLVVKFFELNYLLKLFFVIQFVCFLMLFVGLYFIDKKNPYLAVFVVALFVWAGSWALLVLFWQKLVLVLKNI